MVAHHDGHGCGCAAGVSGIPIDKGTKPIVRGILIPQGCLQLHHHIARTHFLPGTGHGLSGLHTITPGGIDFLAQTVQPTLHIGQQLTLRKFVLKRVAQHRHGHIVARHNDETWPRRIVVNIVGRLKT